MKATTTVTTSTYYGTTNVKSGAETNLNVFIYPQEMIKRLIPYANVQKQKENIKPLKEQTSEQNVSKNVIITQIQHLQSELNNIHAEIIESQNLLNVRDSLYGQLDLLRDERQQIQSDISYLQTQYSSSKQVRVNIRANHGYKEMNQRLRRRMHEIREYIHKMELQNRKIQENINYTNILNIEKNYRTQVNSSNAWIDNAYFNQRERGMGRVDDMITRLHLKQEEALERVRRQQEQINRRNQLNRASMGVNSMMGTQMGSRSYYGQSIDTNDGRRRFYSPDYRY